MSCVDQLVKSLALFLCDIRDIRRSEHGRRRRGATEEERERRALNNLSIAAIRPSSFQAYATLLTPGDDQGMHTCKKHSPQERGRESGRRDQFNADNLCPFGISLLFSFFSPFLKIFHWPLKAKSHGGRPNAPEEQNPGRSVLSHLWEKRMIGTRNKRGKRKGKREEGKDERKEGRLIYQPGMKDWALSCRHWNQTQLYYYYHHYYY